jgi:arylsulfatase A-like enzyme
MTPRNNKISHTLIGLWFRFTTIYAASFLLASALLLFPGKVSGWFYYLTLEGVAFEVAMRFVFAALAAVVFAAVSAAATAPFLLERTYRNRATRASLQMVSAMAVFIDLYIALSVITDWAHLSRTQQSAVCAAFFVVFLLSLWNPTRRKRMTTAFDGILGARTTRRVILAIAAVVVVLAATGRTSPASAKDRHNMARPHPNILLITFDALSAEDMSLYGYRLPTTPRLAEFAHQASVFTNFYSASTFTTPSLASLFTGLAPSETGVYHLAGRLRGARAAQTLPRLLRDSGYTTAAAISSPMAYYLASWQPADFDFLEGPVYRTGGFIQFWNAIGFLHPPERFGSRLDEFQDLERAANFVPAQLSAFDHKLFTESSSSYPPAEIFARTEGLMKRLPEGYFLWVHVMAPHYPYLPGPHLGRFLPGPEMRTAEAQVAFIHGPTYTPELQAEVDKDRLRYDEFVADADSAFGDFISSLQTQGKLANTAVIVSADHGESFQAGVFQHELPYQTLPEIHIPLIVRMPGQERSARVAFVADQTALAPTILEIAGLPRADWMRAPSLVPNLNSDAAMAGSKGLAFTEYLETNSIFRPARSGTAGVTDGVHQYVLNLGTGEGALRNMAEPLIWNIDRSAEEPDAARDLRNDLYSRFPDLPRK